jgi:hypothetical protein
VAENDYGQLFSEARLGLYDRQKFTLMLDAVLEEEKIGVADILAVTKAEFNTLYVIHQRAVVQANQRGVFSKRVEVKQVCPVASITELTAGMEGFRPSLPVLHLQGRDKRDLAQIKWSSGADEREAQKGIEECERWFGLMRGLLQQRGSAGPSRDSGQPVNIVKALAGYGAARWHGAVTAFDVTEFDEMLAPMSADELRAWVTSVAPPVVSAGGWAVLGAQYLVMPREHLLRDLPAYEAIMEGGLSFQRASGVWESTLAPTETVFWKVRHGDEVWLPRREPPPREAAVITPLPVGEERKLTIMNNITDSNEVYVTRPDSGTYLAWVEMPLERDSDRGRIRRETGSAGSLYDLYWQISQQMTLPNHWTDPEFDPFLPFPAPRI